MVLRLVELLAGSMDVLQVERWGVRRGGWSAEAKESRMVLLQAASMVAMTDDE